MAAGVEVLLVAHDVNPLLGFLDRVVYLAAGSALAGTVDEVITAPNLSHLYGAPIEVLRTTDGRVVVVGTPEGLATTDTGTMMNPTPSLNPISDINQC